jgi:hypothetical protein
VGQWRPGALKGEGPPRDATSQNNPQSPRAQKVRTCSVSFLSVVKWVGGASGYEGVHSCIPAKHCLAALLWQPLSLRRFHRRRPVGTTAD